MASNNSLDNIDRVFSSDKNLELIRNNPPNSGRLAMLLLWELASLRLFKDNAELYEDSYGVDMSTIISDPLLRAKLIDQIYS